MSEGIEILDDKDTECFISADVWLKTFPDDTIALPERIMVTFEEGRVQQVFPPVCLGRPNSPNTQAICLIR